MAIREDGQIEIHTENIFPIIKKAVYSDHEIFLRELVSNGVDAIKKRKMASMAGECNNDDEGKIDIKINREEKTLTISDNGIGMNAEEIKKYINQVAFSSAEEFLTKYDQDKEQIIGHFGLGFYSSFMVSKIVEIYTKSALKENNEAIKWKCDGSPNFTLEDHNKEEIGTDIVLYLMEEELEYLEPTRIKTLIKKYCDFMPISISFEGEIINKTNPIWRKSIKELEDKDYIELYKYLYPFQGEPLIWIHLSTDYPYNLQGILYFPKLSGRADWENGEIKLFSNQVFVSDSIKEVVPRYLIPLRGVLDSTDIPLNVSRSALQSDRKVKSIGSFISKKIADKLSRLIKDDPSFYSEVWESISPYIKIGAMEDEKFAEQVKELIIFKTNIKKDKAINSEDFIVNEDKVYTTIKSYRDRMNAESKKILYYTDELAQASALSLWESQGAEIIKADTIIDTQFISWLESKQDGSDFQRVDAEITNDQSDNNKELLDKDGEKESESIKKFFEEAIGNEKVTIKIKSLKGDNTPPTLILLPEQMRRINDVGALMEQRLPGLPDHHVLLVNKAHTLVSGLLKLNSGSVLVSTSQPTETEILAKKLAKHLYEMAKSSIGGLEPNEINDFHSNNASIMAALVDRAL